MPSMMDDPQNHLNTPQGVYLAAGAMTDEERIQRAIVKSRVPERDIIFESEFSTSFKSK